MARRKGIPARHRRVSAELRTLRRVRGLSCKDVAGMLGTSESKISRMETGERGLYPEDVATILGFLQAPPELRQELLTLVREGQERNWHVVHGKLPSNWRNLMRLEDDATAIYNYESLVVPGLAQTPDYARAIIQGGNPRLSETEVENLVASRMARQVILSRRHAPTVLLMMDEMVLRRPVGDPVVLRAQLEHLVSLSRMPKVNVQIVPFAVPANPGLTGPFVILEFPNEPALAYVESRGTSSFLEDEEQVEGAKVAWRGLRAVALSPEDSARLIANVAGELTPDEEHER